MDTVNAVRDLRVRGVKIKSLSAAEASWASCLAADPGTPEAFLADTLLSFMAGHRSRNWRPRDGALWWDWTRPGWRERSWGRRASWVLTKWRQRAGCGGSMSVSWVVFPVRGLSGPRRNSGPGRLGTIRTIMAQKGSSWLLRGSTEGSVDW